VMAKANLAFGKVSLPATGNSGFWLADF
jgi:hypothetical protein